MRRPLSAGADAASSCHRYCGAVFSDALFGNELPEPLRGMGEAVIRGWEPFGYVHALEGERHVILLDRLLPGELGEPPRSEIIGELELGVLEEGTYVEYGTCTVEGNDEARVVAVVCRRCHARRRPSPHAHEERRLHGYSRPAGDRADAPRERERARRAI